MHVLFSEVQYSKNAIYQKIMPSFSTENYQKKALSNAHCHARNSVFDVVRFERQVGLHGNAFFRTEQKFYQTVAVQFLVYPVIFKTKNIGHMHGQMLSIK